MEKVGWYTEHFLIQFQINGNSKQFRWSELGTSSECVEYAKGQSADVAHWSSFDAGGPGQPFSG